MSAPLLATGGLVATIGLADAVNPSTVGPAMALAIQEDGARRTFAFAAGVALVSFVAGAVVVAGPGEAIMHAIPHPSKLVKEVSEEVLGVALLALAILAWLGRRRLARTISEAGGRKAGGAGLGAAFGLGAGIMAIELPTAFAYFGAMAAIIGTRAALPGQLLLVLLFNVVVVLPVLLIAVVRRIAGDEAQPRIERIRDRFARLAGPVLAVLLAAAGLALCVVGLTS